jgi:hypothetical protein
VVVNANTPTEDEMETETGKVPSEQRDAQKTQQQSPGQ